jgi:hypothetical protein
MAVKREADVRLGQPVQCWFLGNTYRGNVVRFNRNGKPVVRFRLKNGKVKEGASTVLAADSDVMHTYKGYLAQVVSE